MEMSAGQGQENPQGKGAAQPQAGWHWWEFLTGIPAGAGLSSSSWLVPKQSSEKPQGRGSRGAWDPGKAGKAIPSWAGGWCRGTHLCHGTDCSQKVKPTLIHHPGFPCRASWGSVPAKPEQGLIFWVWSAELSWVQKQSHCHCQSLDRVLHPLFGQPPEQLHTFGLFRKSF